MLNRTIAYCTILLGSTATAFSQDGLSRDELRVRLDSSNAVLAPTGSDQLIGQEVYQYVALMEALAARDNATPTVVESAGGRFIATIADKTLEVNQAAGEAVVLDTRGYETTLSVDFEEDDASTDAMNLITSIGVDRADMVVRVRHLGSSSRTIGDASTSAPERLATKVFFERRIGGVPVVGDRAVVSYALDGSLRKARLQWRPLDFSQSRTSLAVSRTELEERALDELLALQSSRDLRLVEGEPILLYTAFYVREVSTGVHAATLRAVLMHRVSAIDENTRSQDHVFDP